MVDKNTAGNIVARDEANTLPVAESPTPTRMAKKARVPRLRSTLLRSIQCKRPEQNRENASLECLLTTGIFLATRASKQLEQRAAAGMNKPLQ
jgi:hypothetical protein